MCEAAAQASQQQTDAQARGQLPGWLWIVSGFVMLIIGIALVASGRAAVVNQPAGTCEAFIAAAASDGTQVTLEPGWCSPAALTPTAGLRMTAGGLGAGTQVWFASDKDGGLTLLTRVESVGSDAALPAGSCEAKVVYPYDPTTMKITLLLWPLPSPCLRRLAVPDNLATVTAGLAAGDQVWFGTDSNGELALLRAKEYSIGWMQAAGAVVLACAAIWTLLLIITRGHPWAFALGLDLRLSNSQTQAYLWFLIFVTIYLAEFSLRVYHTHYFGGIGAPPKLLALAGVSAGSFVGARASNLVQSSRDGSATAKGTGKLGRTRWQLLQDLFRNDDGSFDLGDFQMIALTVAAIAVYVVTSVDTLTLLTCASHVDLPQVDETLIGGTAASQGAYLLKMFASRLRN